jgi:hypothetical protein
MSVQKVKIPYNAELSVKTLSVAEEFGVNGSATLGGTINLTGTMNTGSGTLNFSDGPQSKQGVPSITKINKVFSNYTLSSLDERDSIIEMGLKVAGTLTIPADTTALTFPIGTTIDIIQTNSGQITIGGAFGVNLNATPGLKIRSQWSIATLLKRDANTWLVFGDLTA